MNLSPLLLPSPLFPNITKGACNCHVQIKAIVLFKLRSLMGLGYFYIKYLIEIYKTSDLYQSFLYFGFCVLCNIPFYYLSTSLFSDATRCLRLILYFPCPSPGISYFFKEPQILLLENGMSNHEVGTGFV